jgi:hypothetical protein
MTTAAPPKTTFSRFAMALLVGGLIAVGAGSTALYRARAAEADGVIVPAVVTQVGDRQGRYIPVTYRYEAPGPDGKPRPLEKTVMAPVGLVENWAADRKVQVRMARATPEQSDLAESGAAVATGLQWILFGVLATVFGTFRLHKKPDEA